MRPIRLIMTAFGPYRDVETIDFGQLAEYGLFVISGNTGAGKTSIFDAICFALYGTASGEDRSDPRMLRSHFADDEVHTSVQFDFAIGSKRYSVYRQMAHRKGSNKSETGGKAELYELTAAGEQVPLVDRFIVSDVNAKLEAVVGLTKEQFSQIVMLPQGEFRKLLTSDTDNKEGILRRIFRTELYEKLEQRFHAMNRELQDRMKDARASAAAYMKQAQEGLPRRDDSPLSAVFEQPSYTAAQVLEALREEAAHFEGVKGQFQQKRTELAEAIATQESKLRDALAVNILHDEYEGKQRQLQQLEEQSSHYADQEKRLELAARAAQLLPYEEQRTRAEADVQRKRKEQADKLTGLEAAQKDANGAAERHTYEQGRSKERGAAEHELRRLQELEPVVLSLSVQEEQLQQLLKQEREASDRLSDIDKSLERLRGLKQALQAEIKMLDADAARLPEAIGRLQEVEQQGKGLKRLIDLEKELAEFRKLEQKFGESLIEVRQEHTRIETLWIEGQASLLASHLHDGKPCPVCGSESHPNKSAGGAATPSREQLQQTKEMLAAVERELLEVKAQAAAALSARDYEAAELTQAGLSTLELEAQQMKLREEWRSLKEETDKLQQSAKKQQPLKEQLEKCDADIEKGQAHKETLQQEQQRLLAARSAQQGMLQKEYERIPEELRSPERMKQRLQEGQALHRMLESAWEQAQEQHQLAAAKLAEAKAYAQQGAEALTAAESRQAEAIERLSMELHKAGFASMEQYAASVMPEAERATLKKGIDDYRSAKAALEERLQQLKRDLEQKPRVDAAAMQLELEELKNRLEQAIAGVQNAQHSMDEASRLMAIITRASAEMKSLESQLEELLDIYQMLKGDNALKISFERYILIEFLEQILDAANARLRILSNGQFVLQRSDRLEMRGKQSGLGLDVYDAYTGQYRDVKSMSGGEKFNASLCLALGMTDVIQAHQGGVSIEMMFIDEGFGSLDEESLNKAIAALIDLQRAGRMIGVISHVQELKDAFPACIEVTKTRAGFSRTSVTIK